LLVSVYVTSQNRRGYRIFSLTGVTPFPCILMVKSFRNRVLFLAWKAALKSLRQGLYWMPIALRKERGWTVPMFSFHIHSFNSKQISNLLIQW